MKEYIWKIEHISGLFYCSRKGRFNEQVTNLSEKGNYYTSEKMALKVLKEDCNRAAINKAQTERYQLPITKGYFYNNADINDFTIVKFSLERVQTNS